jgi:hypothetical protein
MASVASYATLRYLGTLTPYSYRVTYDVCNARWRERRIYTLVLTVRTTPAPRMCLSSAPVIVCTAADQVALCYVCGRAMRPSTHPYVVDPTLEHESRWPAPMSADLADELMAAAYHPDRLRMWEWVCGGGECLR